MKRLYYNTPLKDIVRIILNSTKLSRFIYKILLSLKNDGYQATKKKVKRKYQIWRKNKRVTSIDKVLTETEKIEQKNRVFSRQITFSIVVPLYNTPKKFLVEMIQSVQNQTYQKWELCMADGSDEEHTEVAKICGEFASRDSRIKYKKLEKNLGISKNTNASLEMATGDYIGLFDHDDLLHPSVLYYYMYEICSHNADFIYCDELTFEKRLNNPIVIHHKPDFAIDNLRANNYICHFTVFSKALMDKVGMFNAKYDGSQDYDMILRLTEQAEQIRHVPEILYYWRAHANSVASDISAKMYTLDAAKEALSDHLERCNLKAEIVDAHDNVLSWYRSKYEITGNPLVSILIPNKDSMRILKQCVDSIMEKTSYTNYEIVIVENNSTESETYTYYKELEKNERTKVVTWTHEFNYSKINNYGVEHCNGEYIILLNNDIEVITPNWIEEMLMLNQRKDVGAVGAMLYYPDNTIQHAGVIIGLGGVAGHSHKHFKRGDVGYMRRLQYAQNLSAVTAACMMVKRSVFEELDGLDEGFAVAFNDVDFCMRIREAGYLICWTPFAELYHHESITRGYEDTPEKQARFSGEVNRFQNRWGAILKAGDPYYNKNLTLDREDFGFK